MSSKYISIEKFAKRSNVKVKTVIKRINKIPRVEKDKLGNYRVLKGTRYPCKRTNITKTSSMYIKLLNAIDAKQYIDYTYFNFDDERDFKRMLNDYEKNGYIIKNDSLNIAGANSYDLTSKGASLVNNKKSEILKIINDITNTIANVTTIMTNIRK